MKRLAGTVLLASALPLICSTTPGGGQDTGPRNLQAPQVVKLTQTGGAFWPSWSPGSNQIAFYNRVGSYEAQIGQNRQEPVCDLWIMNSDGSNAHLVWEGGIRGAYGWAISPPSWSNDGRYIAIDTRYGRCPVIEVAGGTRVSGTIFPEDCAAPRFSRFSPYLAFTRFITDFGAEPAVQERSIVILDYESGEERVLHKSGFNAETEWYEWPSVWSGDEQILRVADDSDGGATYHFFSTASGELLFRSNDPGGGEEYSEFFPDRAVSPSDRLRVKSPVIPPREFTGIIHSGAGTGLQVCLTGEEGSEILLLDIGAHVYSFQWHPRRDILLFAAGQKSEDPGVTGTSNIYLAIFIH